MYHSTEVSRALNLVTQPPSTQVFVAPPVPLAQHQHTPTFANVSEGCSLALDHREGLTRWDSCLAHMIQMPSLFSSVYTDRVT